MCASRWWQTEAWGSKHYRFPTEDVYFNYIIRFRGVIAVESASSENRTGRE